MYKLPKLPYSYEALEPFIDTHTMGLHYHKHAQNYLDKLNTILKENNYDYRYNINELINHLDQFPKETHFNLLYNLGGVLNHILYWQGLNPTPEKPRGKLLELIESTYGSYDAFWQKIKEKALELKGSGYTFLTLKQDKTLNIINLPNQEMPTSIGQIPLFNIDMWEHAYYLNYKNEKSNYLDNLKKIASFSNASKIIDTITDYSFFN